MSSILVDMYGWLVSRHKTDFWNITMRYVSMKVVVLNGYNFKSFSGISSSGTEDEERVCDKSHFQ